MDEEQFTIKQASERLGVPVWIMRRLCRKGLISHIRRNNVGYQILDANQLSFAKMLLALERAGMSRKSLKRFASLFRQGESSLAERKAMLETQRRQFWQELEDIQAGIDTIERQIELIDMEMKK